MPMFTSPRAPNQRNAGIEQIVVFYFRMRYQTRFFGPISFKGRDIIITNTYCKHCILPMNFGSSLTVGLVENFSQAYFRHKVESKHLTESYYVSAYRF